MEKLLFIDDDLDFLESNRIYFTRKGYKIYQCSSPKEAWELLQNTAFDCVILDIDSLKSTAFLSAAIFANKAGLLSFSYLDFQIQKAGFKVFNPAVTIFWPNLMTFWN